MGAGLLYYHNNKSIGGAVKTPFPTHILTSTYSEKPAGGRTTSGGGAAAVSVVGRNVPSHF